MEKGDPPTIVFCGATGVGKSSVINMLADHPDRSHSKPARTGNTAKGVTSQPHTFSKRLNEREYRVIDTVGLGEGPRGAVPTDKAIASLYDVLTRPGGINLVVFVLRCRPLTQASTNYYNILKFLCDPKVPIALVVTGVENEAEWTKWWDNQQQPEGITFVQNACVVSSQVADRSQTKSKFEKSKEILVKMITTSALPLPHQVTRRPEIPDFVRRTRQLLRDKSTEFSTALNGLLHEWQFPTIVFVGATIDGSSLIDWLPNNPHHASQKDNDTSTPDKALSKTREFKKSLNKRPVQVFKTPPFDQGDDGSTVSPEAIEAFYDLLVDRQNGANLIVLALRQPGSVVDKASRQVISLICGTSVPIVTVRATSSAGEQDKQGQSAVPFQAIQQIEVDPEDSASRACLVSAIEEAVANFPFVPAARIKSGPPPSRPTWLSRLLAFFGPRLKDRNNLYKALVGYGVPEGEAERLCRRVKTHH